MNWKHRSKRAGRMSIAGIAGAVALVAALLLAGCGGSSGGDSTSAEASTQSSAEGSQPGGPGGFELSEETRACLEEQGVELPEPGQGGPPEGEFPEGGPPEGELPEGGPPQGFEGGAGMKEALEECGAELPQGKPGGPSNSSDFRESIQEYTDCMNENGYELPEPNLSGEGPVFKESEVDQEDPAFEAANEECRSVIGGPGESG